MVELLLGYYAHGYISIYRKRHEIDHLICVGWCFSEPLIATLDGAFTNEAVDACDANTYLLFNQMAAIPFADLHAVFAVCGITDAAIRTRIIDNEGFATLADVGELESDQDVLEMAKRMSSRTQGEGRVTLGTVQIKHLQSLVWWVRDRRKRNLALNANDFNVAARDAAKMDKAIEKDRRDGDVSVKDLNKFDPDDFDIHEDAFLNLLAQTKGAQRESLRYVVRAEQEPDDFVDEQEERMFQMPLAGPGFQEDNRAVYRLLKSFLIDTAGWAWIEQYGPTENGRAAFWAWSNHYNGQGELSKRTSLAKARVEGLHYKNERSMSFEKYTELLTKSFTTLDKDEDERLSERQKVEKLLKGISTPDAELTACKAVISQNYRTDFTGACAYFSQEVARLHGGAQLENRKYRNKRRISEVNTGRGRGNGGRGRGRGRFGGRGRGGRGYGGRGGGGRDAGTMINGVDVSDPTRAFDNNEWEALRHNGGRAYVNQARERINGGRGRGRGRDQGRGGGRNIGAVERNNQEQGGGENQQQGGNNAGRGNGERGGQNGRGFGRGAYQQNQH